MVAICFCFFLVYWFRFEFYLLHVSIIKQCVFSAFALWKLVPGSFWYSCVASPCCFLSAQEYLSVFGLVLSFCCIFGILKM